jgi:hypothetical protein
MFAKLFIVLFVAEAQFICICAEEKLGPHVPCYHYIRKALSPCKCENPVGDDWLIVCGAQINIV